MITACFKPQILGSEFADVFAVHCFVDRFGVRNDAKPFLLRLEQRLDADRLDLGKDVVGLFLADQLENRFFVLHVDDMRMVRDKMGRSVFVAVDGDHFDPQTLCFDRDLFAEFAGA